jgi:hypothetical protein
MNYNSSSTTVYNKSNTNKYPSFENNCLSSYRSSISSIENNSDSEWVYSSDENEAPLESEPTKESKIERDMSLESESIEQERTCSRLSDSDNSSENDVSYNTDIPDKSYAKSFNHTISNITRMEDKHNNVWQSSARNETTEAFKSRPPHFKSNLKSSYPTRSGVRSNYNSTYSSDLKHALPESSFVSQETHTYYSSTPSSKEVKKKEEITGKIYESKTPTSINFRSKGYTPSSNQSYWNKTHRPARSSK